jgi:RHS repeat-associated protein
MKKINFTTYSPLALVPFLFFVYSISYSQTPSTASIETDLPKITTPSPTVASLMKFEEVPVNNYTGIPDISIPLYSIGSMSKNININLALKYHPSSIAVKEVAGYTGLGWSLFAGGSISRVVRGIPDEMLHTGGTSGNNKAMVGIYHNNIGGIYRNDYYEAMGLLGTTMTPAQQEKVSKYMWYAFEKGIMDSDHDLYQINFMGQTGRFYIKMTSTGVLEVVKLDNDNNLRIEFNYTFDNNQPTNKYNFTGFTIYDDHGYKYVFDVREQTTETSVLTNQTFRLTDSPSSNYTYPMTFVSSYHLSKIYDNNQQPLVEFTFQNSLEVITETSDLNYYIDPPAAQPFIETQLNSGDIVGLLPKSSSTIKTKSIATKKIQQIDIINKARIAFVLEQGRQDFRLNSNAHKLKSVIIKDWAGLNNKQFDFEYGYSSSTYGALENKRLVLERVKEKNFINSDELIYECAYKYKTLTAANGSYDYWGYYKNHSQSRETDPTYCVAGVLEKLILPTGGFIKFNFESNTYSYIGDEAVTDFEVHPDYWDISTQNYVLNSSTQTVSQSLGSTTFPRIISHTYTMTPNSTDGFAFIKDANNQTPAMVGHNRYYLQPNVQYFIQFSWVNNSTPGTLNSTIETRTHPIQTEEFLYGGGIRIKSIEFHENLTSVTPASIKKYNYNFFETSKTSGALVFPKPVFEYYRTVRSVGSDLSYHVIADFNNLMAIKTKGADVGYQNVTVSDSSTDENGFTQYTYSSPIDHPEANYTITYPFQPSANYDYKRGLLLKEKHFRKINLTSTQAVSETTYNYDWAGDEVTLKTGIRGYYTIGCPFASTVEDYDAFITLLNQPGNSGFYSDCNPNFYLTYLFNFEHFGWTKLLSKTTKNYYYDTSGNSFVQVNESYDYNPINKKLNYNTVTNHTTGELVKTNYYYDADLANRNRIGVIKKIETRKNTELIETKQINYSNTWTTNQSYLPASILVSKANHSLDTKIRFLRYDIYGNPLELKRENDITMVYLWGYNQSYPIASIENATYSQVTTALGTTNISEANLAAINALRSNATFQNAMITTYTYKPLEGLTSITDPKGYTTTFTYDAFGRFKNSKDANQNIINAYEYYYRNQTQNQNFVKSITYKRPSNQVTINLNQPTDVLQEVSFVDGLGRPIQQVAYKKASNGGDIIVPIEYDTFGRQLKEYLPYVRSTSSLNYDSSWFSAVSTFYASNTIQNTGNPHFATTTFPFSLKDVEKSPLGRVLKQSAPGLDWSMGNGKEIKFDYQANAANEVRNFTVVAQWNPSTQIYNPTLSNPNSYPANSLFKTVTKDENWVAGSKNHTTEVFKNNLGQVVLKRTYTDVTAPNGDITPQVQHDTYYVYDQFGNLSFVIPPLVDTSGTISDPDLQGLCYQYKYDALNRLAEKKLPGKGWEFIVYDKLDRPVYTGPALNPFDGIANGWNITKYDAFGRVVYTGWLADAGINTTRRSQLQGFKNAEAVISETKSASNATIDGVTIRYSNSSLPNSGLKLLTINYYDTYSYPNAPVIPTPIFGQTVLSNAKGLATGSWVRVLNLTGSPILAERSHSFYDVKGRAIRSYTLNHLGGFTQTDMQLDFIGQVGTTITTHRRSPAEAIVTTNEYFEYTEQGRLRNHYHQINGGEMERLTISDYDNLGQLISKDVGGAPSMETGLQKVNYIYNIRGWLTNINSLNHLEENPGQFDDLFAFKINYNSVENSVGNQIKELFNGNISETFWQTASDFDVRKYGYKYDQLNRLQKAIYQKPEAISPIRNSYNESLWYDKNGNITALQRNGEIDDIYDRIEIDKLTYIYEPSNKNRLSIVDDSSNITHGFKDDDTHPDPLVIDSTIDYTYDDYGNMKTDTNKGITTPITYNHLNLPIKINLPNGIIEYLYNAAGVKVQKKVTIGSTIYTTDYQNGYQYLNTQLQFFPHAEGYVNVLNGERFNYVYNYTDHLGNIRVSYGLDPESNVLKILEENHYYPFGLKHKNYGVDMRTYQENNLGQIRLPLVSEVSYKYKYNGKEWQDELGLNIYDMDMRQYDPSIARWVVQDPVVHFDYSPYSAFDNNPVFWADPSGADATNGIVGDDEFSRRMIAKSNSDASDGWTIGETATDPKKKIDNSKNGAKIEGAGVRIREEPVTPMTPKGPTQSAGLESLLTVALPPSENSSRPMLSQWNGDRGTWGNWAHSENFFASLSYNLVNDAYLSLQVFDFDLLARDEWSNPFTGARFGNLDGTPNYHQDMGFINTLTQAIPFQKGVYGFNLLKTYSASQFSKLTMGTLFNKTVSPQLRGLYNKTLNNFIRSTNLYIDRTVYSRSQKSLVQIPKAMNEKPQ